MTCRYCEVAGYLDEEAAMSWRSPADAGSIRALAQAWRDRCECGGKREGKLLSSLRALLRHRHGDLPVR